MKRSVKMVRIAILADGTIQIWDKSLGICLDILDYRKSTSPTTISAEAETEIGFDGDY